MHSHERLLVLSVSRSSLFVSTVFNTSSFVLCSVHAISNYSCCRNKSGTVFTAQSAVMLFCYTKKYQFTEWLVKHLRRLLYVLNRNASRLGMHGVVSSVFVVMTFDSGMGLIEAVRL